MKISANKLEFSHPCHGQSATKPADFGFREIDSALSGSTYQNCERTGRFLQETQGTLNVGRLQVRGTSKIGNAELKIDLT